MFSWGEVREKKKERKERKGVPVQPSRHLKEILSGPWRGGEAPAKSFRVLRETRSAPVIKTASGDVGRSAR